MAACAVAFSMVGHEPVLGWDAGIVAGWDIGQALDYEGVGSMAVAVALNVAIAMLMVYINKAFNVLRCLTMLHASLFLVFELATPSMLLGVTPGIVVCFVLMLSLMLMFAAYGRRDFQRPIFLAFFLLSAFGALDYAFLVYLPVLWLGLAQMRVLSLRSVLASFLGVLTPWILYLGLGIVDVADLRVPRLISFVDNGAFLSAEWPLLCTAGITAMLGVGSWMQNVLKVISYNAQSRAMAGLLTTMLGVTLLAMLTNYPHAAAFLPVLNFSAAMQLGHLFGVIHRSRGSQWAILIIVFVYISIYAWRTLICIL